MARPANPEVLTADSRAPLSTFCAAHTHTQKPSHQFVSACQIKIIKYYRSQVQLTSLMWFSLEIGVGWNRGGRDGGTGDYRILSTRKWRGCGGLSGGMQIHSHSAGFLSSQAYRHDLSFVPTKHVPLLRLGLTVRLLVCHADTRTHTN